MNKKNLLKIAQDTLQVYGDSIFRLSSLNIAGHTIEGFLIDRTARKIYFRDNGLYVSNINGSHIVCICPDKTTAICIDGGGNRIYWSTSQGVWRMPLVQTENNQFTYIPKLVNSQKDVIKIAINREDNAPEIDPVRQIINGIKLFILAIIYIIIPIIIMAILSAINETLALLGLILGFILLIVFAILLVIAQCRFAKTESLGEALNIGQRYGEFVKLKIENMSLQN